MSIENFLSNFDKQNEEAANRKIQAEEAKKQAEEAEKTYLEEYKGHFENKVVPQIHEVGKKLAEKFDLEYTKPVIMQRNNYFSTVTFKPKFDHYTKKVRIQLTCEAGRKLVTISAESQNENDKQIGEGILTFQDTFETFSPLNLESEFSKILEKIFIRKQ